MTDQLKYRLLLSLAGVFYLWGLGAMWVAHEQAMPESQFFYVGILPVVAGVCAMVGALYYRMDLFEE